MFSNPVNIGEVTISPSGPTVTAGEPVTLECSVDITPNPLPQSTPSLEFEWFFGPTNELHSSTTTSSGNTYISTLQIAMVEESDEGMYTCQLRGNQRTAASTMITVNTGEPVYLAHTNLVVPHTRLCCGAAWFINYC